MVCTHILHSIIAGNKRWGRPRRRWISNIDSPSQTVFTCRRQKHVHGVTWCPCWRFPIFTRDSM